MRKAVVDRVLDRDLYEDLIAQAVEEVLRPVQMPDFFQERDAWQAPAPTRHSPPNPPVAVFPPRPPAPPSVGVWSKPDKAGVRVPLPPRGGVVFWCLPGDEAQATARMDAWDVQARVARLASEAP